MKKAALYARVSSEAQKQERTIDSQVAELKRQIAAAGDTLVEEYVDDGYSGAETRSPEGVMEPERIGFCRSPRRLL
jgi:site-specific DNA recombinase